MKRESSMSTTVSHPLPSTQAHAIAELTGYEDAATLRWQQVCVQAVYQLTALLNGRYGKAASSHAFGAARHWRFAGGAFTPPLTKGMLTPPWNFSIRFFALTGGAYLDRLWIRRFSSQRTATHPSPAARSEHWAILSVRRLWLPVMMRAEPTRPPA